MSAAKEAPLGGLKLPSADSAKAAPACMTTDSTDNCNPLLSQLYLDAAWSLGHELARRKIGLVYGGASVGVMGKIADSVLEAGGNVTGILPKGIIRQEIPHSNLTDMIEVATMHERKLRMAELADGFIALPGGLGTLDSSINLLISSLANSLSSWLKCVNKP